MNATIETPTLPEAVKRRRGRPMLPMAAVKAVTNLREKAILDAIDEGRLFWVWNVSLDPKTSHCRELRFLSEEVGEFATGMSVKRDLDIVVGLLLPHIEPMVGLVEVRDAFNISDAHALSLGERHQLDICRKGRRGHGGQTLFTRQSIFRFLKVRLVS